MNATTGHGKSSQSTVPSVHTFAVVMLCLLASVTVSAATRQRAVTAKTTERKPSPSLASLPTPSASGPLRILVVDDDASDNNNTGGRTRESRSDTVFGDLVSAAIGDKDDAWSVEYVQDHSNGPDIERLRSFPLILWYTGASYGGNPDNSSVLSLQDEKTVRRYLEEVGGAVVLFSPGYAEKVLDRASSWEDSSWSFLTEVLGIRGGLGLAQRFLPGTVSIPNGQQFQVGKGDAAVETQFSLVNPDGAAVVFTTTLAAAKGGGQPSPVATAFSYGKGRIVYVGFTFENLAAADAKPAFQQILAATGLPFAQMAPPATTALTSTPSLSARGGERTLNPPPDLNVAPATPGLVADPNLRVERVDKAPVPAPLTVQVGGTALKTVVKWTLPSAPTDGASMRFATEKGTRQSTAPDPGLTVKVERWTWISALLGDVYDWVSMNVEPGALQVVDAAARPGTTQRYRVTVTNASGASGFKEAEYTVPTIDPPSLSANQESDGTVVLNWPAVPGVTRYQIETFNPIGSHLGSYPPTVVIGAAQWRSPPLDDNRRIWAVTSLYPAQGGEYASMSRWDSWPTATTEPNPEYVLTKASFEIVTGDDNKELLSHFEIRLYINGGGNNTDPNNLQQYGVIVGSKDVELPANPTSGSRWKSYVTLTETWKPGGVWAPALGELGYIKQYGLRVVIKYFPNFFLDAWKLDKVVLTVSFQKANQIAYDGYSAGMKDRVIMARDVGKLLTERDNQVELIIDGSNIAIP